MAHPSENAGSLGPLLPIVDGFAEPLPADVVTPALGRTAHDESFAEPTSAIVPGDIGTLDLGRIPDPDYDGPTGLLASTVPDGHGPDTEIGRFGHLHESMHRLKTKLIMGAAATATVVSLALSANGPVLHKLAEVAPWVGSGMIMAEIGWLGGAAVAFASVGRRIKNPFRIRSEMKNIAQYANESIGFKVGLAVNTASALAEFAIPTAAALTKLPPETWGLLGFPSLDLVATVAVRGVILRGMQNARQQTSASQAG